MSAKSKPYLASGLTKDKVCSCTEGEEDEEDGAQTQISHSTGVRTSTGALHPEEQGPSWDQARPLDDGGGLTRVTVIMHHCCCLRPAGWSRRGESGRVQFMRKQPQLQLDCVYWLTEVCDGQRLLSVVVVKLIAFMCPIVSVEVLVTAEPFMPSKPLKGGKV